MKNRIRQLMESQHMNQQSFAAYIGIAPASLSSMLQERTRPTLNTVEAVMKKMPQVNLKWLLSGDGEMFVKEQDDDLENLKMAQAANVSSEATLDFGSTISSSPAAISTPAASGTQNSRQQNFSHTRTQVQSPEVNQNVLQMKNVDKNQRRITEIRIFYDDLTYESFVPKK